jgi:hypothetical protein
VQDVGLARTAQNAPVRPVRQFKGTPNKLHIGRRQILACLSQEMLQFLLDFRRYRSLRARCFNALSGNLLPIVHCHHG